MGWCSLLYPRLNLLFLSVSFSIGKCQRGRSEAAKFSNLGVHRIEGKNIPHILGYEWAQMQRLIQTTSPVFCKQKVWICSQSLSVKCLGSLCVASVEEKGAKIGEQLWVGHCINRLLVHL